ncbi:hypothetical protein KCP76_18520 [Salmonella enterica subsp. enterica serovar Weltevreden]|nr:hypothetical protein KCP76_18520 [Salmonella enterica subsp. enterica serovar Weltevreden]
MLGGCCRTGARSASRYLLSDQNLVWWKKNAEPLSWLRAGTSASGGDY